MGFQVEQPLKKEKKRNEKQVGDQRHPVVRQSEQKTVIGREGLQNNQQSHDD
ncbi:hypothetical protein SDC9_112257 [bioreactor metagenome]|uniref:Uncharacterized protein n=1 Tax=bioreactor metagenome TaxID=1076179 RepID=A0A645BJC3_9ZZZZ